MVGMNNSYSQSNWEPLTNITGYISTEFNYFNELEDYRVNYGSSVSEAGLLMTYRPTSNFTIRGVFVYRPNFDFDQMLNEAFGQYSFSSALNVKIGRYLLPVSPMNTYYYAPVNTSATLPILITNNEFFPVNMDGVSMNGQFGNNFRFRYDLFAGGYQNSTWLKTGALGFFGDEVSHYKKLVGSMYTVDPSYNKTYNVGFGGSAGFSYKTYADIGFSIFKPKKESFPVGVNLPENAAFPGSPEMYVVQDFTMDKMTYGINFRFQFNQTRLLGEFWFSDFDGDAEDAIDVDLEGSFFELSQSIEKVTPYIRYEYQITDDIEYKRYSAGINYKPSFERTFKLEYLLYEHDVKNISGLVASFIYSF